jgi:hypothetical protein
MKAHLWDALHYDVSQTARGTETGGSPNHPRPIRSQIARPSLFSLPLDWELALTGNRRYCRPPESIPSNDDPSLRVLLRGAERCSLAVRQNLTHLQQVLYFETSRGSFCLLWLLPPRSAGQRNSSPKDPWCNSSSSTLECSHGFLCWA